MSRKEALELQESAWEALNTLHRRVCTNGIWTQGIVTEIQMWTALHTVACQQLATVPAEDPPKQLLAKLKEIRHRLETGFRFLTVVPTSLREASRLLDELIHLVEG